VAEESQRLGLGLLECPFAARSAAAFSGGLDDHGEAHGGEQIKQPGESFGVIQLSRLELDEAPQEQSQQKVCTQIF